MTTHWLVLLPPLFVLVSAFITRRLNPSLAIGIISAAFIAYPYSLTDAARLAINRIYTQLTDPSYLFLYGFLFIIGILITLINRTGGANAFAHHITERLRSKKSVETSSLLLSTILFIDDYLSSLTVGYIMRPLTDRFSIARTKLAYLVHSLSGPLVILIPITSWLAMITGQLHLAGICMDSSSARITADPFYIYLNTIPYIFYSIILIASVWFVVRRKISYGPMHEHELIAQRTGNLFGGKTPLKAGVEQCGTVNGAMTDLLLPLGILFISVFSAILFFGGFWLFGGVHSLIEALKNNNNTFCALFLASTITLSLSLIIALARHKITCSMIPSIFIQGLKLMEGAVLMVILASTLGTILKTDLSVGAYVAHAIAGAVSPTLLPVIIFIIATIVATITGSSWGTIAILLPNTIQLLTTLLNIPQCSQPDNILLLYPILGALFSGAVCGDHISPISETTIMAATSSGSYPMDHAYTQIFYALPAIAAAALSYTVIGYLTFLPTLGSLIASLAIGICSCFICLILLDKHWKQSSFTKKD